MIRRQKVRKAVRWARYFNRYGHQPDAIVGGWGAVRAIRAGGLHWGYVRQQAKRRFGATS